MGNGIEITGREDWLAGTKLAWLAVAVAGGSDVVGSVVLTGGVILSANIARA